MGWGLRAGGWGLQVSPVPAPLQACRCIYEGKTYGYEEVIYNTTDGLGACLLAICGNNGTIIRSVVECPGTLSTTPFTFTTTAAPPSTTGEPGGCTAGPASLSPAPGPG